MNVEGTEFSMLLSNKCFKCTLCLGRFSVDDSWASTKNWPALMATEEDASNEKAVWIEFETNKDFVECPFHIDININHSLKVVANIPLVKEVTRTMSVALQNEKLDFGYFISLALNHIMKF